MNALNYFKDKLKEGQIMENIAVDLLRKKLNVEVKEISFNYKYDFKMSNGQTYEIKNDKASDKTGNFFIEYKTSEGKPSGISTTEAINYGLYNNNKLIFIKTDILREITKDHKVAFCQGKFGVPGAYGFIIKVDEIISNSYLILDIK